MASNVVEAMAYVDTSDFVKKNTNSAGHLVDTSWIDGLHCRRYAIQPGSLYDEAVPDESETRHPYAVAMEWVSRITTVALEMVLPGLLGVWLDRRWGTAPWIGLIGFGLGMVLAIWHLLQMTRASKSKGGSHDPPSKDSPS